MILTVTQEHIDGGRSCCQPRAVSCPIAMAARDAGLWNVQVHPKYIFWEDEGELVSAKLPDCAIDFIQRFDSGEPVEPFSFEIHEL